MDDFKLFRKQDSYFVDKSLFIEQIIEDGSQVLLFPRPRRFGKTLNMSMLNYFFNHHNAEENSKLFKGLGIEKIQNFEEHQGKYPVIFLSFKSCKGDSYEKVLAGIKNVIANSFKLSNNELEDTLTSKDEKEEYSLLSQKEADESLLSHSLLLLTRLLSRKYNKKVIVLLDEYDTPVHEGYLHGFYDKIVNLLRIMLGNALKGNEHLQKGVLTGILRVSIESMFSDLNNVMVYSVLSKDYSTAFGFTQKETDQILHDYGLDQLKDQVKNWYNGYYFGDEEIYNPWSILSFTKNKGEFRPFWLSTSANELVHQIIKDSDKTVKTDIEELLNNKPVYATFSENIAFPDLVQTREIILSFLIQTGYLKARFHEFTNQENIFEISIPNQELRNIYQAVVLKWFNDSIGRSDLNEMLKALISGDIELFGEILSNFVVNYLSYYHTTQDHIEKVYHAFVLGMLIQLQDSYHIESERESGYGRVDVLMTPEDKSKPGIIMELKKIRVSENKDSALAAALAQIEERQYETLLQQQGCQNIMKLAVTFDGKRVWVKNG